MNDQYHNAVADHGATLITHIGLVDENGDEITGGDPAYERKGVTWTDAGDGTDDPGTIRPTTDLTFDVPANVTVAGWRGYSALTGGIDYGGVDYDAEDHATADVQWQYKLEADQTAINHTAPSA